MKTLFLALVFAAIVMTPNEGFSQGLTNEFVVYGVYNALSMGNPGEKPRRDFYINMGTNHGVRQGGRVKVFRKLATHNLMDKKLHKDMVVPVAHLKVIHAEKTVAIARVEKMVPLDEAAVLSPQSPIIGDIVRLSR